MASCYSSGRVVIILLNIAACLLVTNTWGWRSVAAADVECGFGSSCSSKLQMEQRPQLLVECGGVAPSVVDLDEALKVDMLGVLNCIGKPQPGVPFKPSDVCYDVSLSGSNMLRAVCYAITSDDIVLTSIDLNACLGVDRTSGKLAPCTSPSS
ncbi:hypothetical protein GOP47_0029229 [Adiantum capillus-veneris]|nr:hypothetical protein GOP47_0029229 [Adiantum capillus-veneris]